MARKVSIEAVRDETVERIVVAGVSKIGVLVPPWVLLGLLTGVAAIAHAMWGKPPMVTWIVMATTLSTFVLTSLTFVVSHHRGWLGRTHSTLTALLTGLWFTVAIITGVGQPVTVALLLVGGGTVCLCWNVRGVIRAQPGEAVGGDPMGWLFDQSKKRFGLDGAKVRTTEVAEHKVKGVIELPAGEKTASDVIKKAEYIEGGMHFPPGSVHIAADEDDASRAHYTVTDPRVMRRPLPWPGGYAPGASIAVALRTGLFQDMDPVLHVLPGHHLQLMGMVGSGKSIGGCWNYAAEIVSRYDTAFFGTDISKGEQTLGPVRPAMHRFETTEKGAKALLNDLHREIPNRTTWLSEHGFQKWAEGCGLLYWVWWIEEAPKFIASLSDKDQEKFEEVVKEARSAGVTVVLSMQRSDYTQLPTLVRGQLAKMCFGVENESDASFGLSSRQQQAEARPEMWGSRQPGMAYLDAPSIPATHVAMPLRTYTWGKTDKEAQANFTAYIAQFPASAKQADKFTAAIADASGSAARPGAAIPMPAGAPVDRQDDVDQEHGEVSEGVAELLAAAAELVIAAQYATAQMIGRKLRVGEADSLRIVEALERKGIIGPHRPNEDGRQVLVPVEDAESVLRLLRDEGDPVAEYVRTPDPSPDVIAGPATPVPELAPEEAERFRAPAAEGTMRQGGKMSPNAARDLVHAWIRERAQADRVFMARDLTPVREQTGFESRGWIRNLLRDLIEAGVLEETGAEGAAIQYRILDVGPLDGPATETRYAA